MARPIDDADVGKIVDYLGRDLPRPDSKPRPERAHVGGGTSGFPLSTRSRTGHVCPHSPHQMIAKMVKNCKCAAIMIVFRRNCDVV